MNTPPDAPFVVTLRDVWEAVHNLSEKLEGVPAAVRDHETRIRQLERWVWWAAGIGSAGGLGLSKLFS